MLNRIPVAAQAALAVVLCGLSSAAWARVETFTWQHEAPDQVASFKLYSRTDPVGAYAVVDVGKQEIGTNRFQADLPNVPDDATLYVCVSAVGTNGLESDCSNERVRAPDTTPTDPGTTDPGTGDPPPDTTDPAPIVVGDALWMEDFEGQAVGTVVPGFLDTQPNNGLVEDDSLFSVAALPTGNQVLKTSSTQTNIHSHYIGNDDAGTPSANWAAYEYTGQMLVTNDLGGIGVTFYSAYPNADVYYRLRRYDTGLFHFAPHGFGTGYSCVKESTGVRPTANTWYAFRVQVIPNADGTGTRMLAKVWIATDAEPAAFQADCSDTSSGRPVSGRVGVWSMGAGDKYWDNLAIAPISEPTNPAPADLGQPGRPYLVQ